MEIHVHREKKGHVFKKNVLNIDGEKKEVSEREIRVDINVELAGLGASDHSGRRCRICRLMRKRVRAITPPSTALQGAM